MTLERLCAQGVPGWGPMLKTTAASVGLTVPSQVASAIPRAYTPVTMNSSRGKQDFVTIFPSSPLFFSCHDSLWLCMRYLVGALRSSVNKGSAQERQLHIFVALEMPEDITIEKIPNQ